MIDLTYFKNKLETEKKRLEASLNEIGTTKIHPDQKNHWEATPSDKDMEIEMRDEVADRLEDLGERQATEETLETRLDNINEALKRIADNKYGLCRIDGGEIELEKLEANPATTTCKTHVDEED